MASDFDSIDFLSEALREARVGGEEGQSLSTSKPERSPRKLSFEDLPSEVILKIVGKLLYPDQDARTDMKDFENLRMACSRVEALVKKNECSLANSICAKLYPAHHIIYDCFTVDNFLSIQKMAGEIKAFVRDTDRLLVRKPESVPRQYLVGVTARRKDWLKIIKIGLTFFQYHNGLPGSGLKKWQVAVAKMPNYAMLIFRYTALVVFELYACLIDMRGYEVGGDGSMLEIDINEGNRCALVEVMLWNAEFELIAGAVRVSVRSDDYRWGKLESRIRSTILGSAMKEKISQKESAQRLLSQSQQRTWERIEKAYEIPSADAHDPCVRYSLAAETDILAKLLGKELKSKTATQVVRDIFDAYEHV